MLRHHDATDATGDYEAGLAGVLRAMGLAPVAGGAAPSAAAPPPGAFRALPAERLPASLTQLGFVGRAIDDVEVILPPLCDVPAGEFPMGSDPAQDAETRPDEQPQHPVALAAFRVGRFPVTVAEYACFVRAGQREPRTDPFRHVTWQQQLGRLEHPVVNVTWNDARDYCGWLGHVTGQPWRLPTEAEWEKAARWDPAARHMHVYPWVDAFEQRRCNTSGSGKGTTTPVGNYPAGASPCGAQDMAGNVWEWTSSLFKPYPYKAGDGRERTDSAGSRVPRGGSWFYPPRCSRAAHRNAYTRDETNSNVGARVVASAVPSV